MAFRGERPRRINGATCDDDVQNGEGEVEWTKGRSIDSVLWKEVTMQAANTATSEKLFLAGSDFRLKAEEMVESAALSR